MIGLLRRSLVQNVLALYSVQFVTYLLPLVTFPYLTRVLGVERWGLYAFFLSFAQYAMTIVEYTFILSGARDVSRHRDDLQMRSNLITGIIGAKLLLAGIVVGCCFVLQIIVPAFQAQPLIFWMGIFWGVSFGFSLLWYFQGLERMRLAAAMDLTAKIVSTIFIFLLIRSPEDVWKIFFIYSTANLFTIGAAVFLIYRQVSFHRPTWALTLAALKNGWHLFTARLVVNIMAVGNLFILGLFVPAAAVGYYAGADKIAKPAGSLGEPITNALFPRLSLMIHENPERAIRLVRLSLMATVALGATLTLLIFFAAPLLIRIFMGAEYPEAVEIMRVLAWLPLLLAPIGAIGTQWMLPLHLDRYLNAVIAITTGINLVLALLLIPRFGGIGMAWSVIICKLLELSGFTLVLIWLRVHPLRLSLDNLKGVLARRAFHEN